MHTHTHPQSFSARVSTVSSYVSYHSLNFFHKVVVGVGVFSPYHNQSRTKMPFTHYAVATNPTVFAWVAYHGRHLNPPPPPLPPPFPVVNFVRPHPTRACTHTLLFIKIKRLVYMQNATPKTFRKPSTHILYNTMYKTQRARCSTSIAVFFCDSFTSASSDRSIGRPART